MNVKFNKNDEVTSQVVSFVQADLLSCYYDISFWRMFAL